MTRFGIVLLCVFLFVPIAAVYGQTSLLGEVGLIVAQQVVFGGLGLLSTIDHRAGTISVGGLDAFFGVMAFVQAFDGNLDAQSVGMTAIGVGFLTKAAYNVFFAHEARKPTRFWVNYLAFNLLVYTGYIFTDFIAN